MLTTQKQIRDMFWQNNPQFKRKGKTKQNDYPADIRVSFCDFVDYLRRDGQITEKMADKVTL